MRAVPEHERLARRRGKCHIGVDLAASSLGIRAHCVQNRAMDAADS
jgi:hypothetical protein